MRGVRRRDGRAPVTVAPPPAAPLPPTPAPRTAPTQPAAAHEHRPLAVGHAPPGLDRATWERFRAGRIGPQRTLDLHGRTVQAAFHALLAFVTAAHADRLRVVEVITGGSSARGAIRRELPAWLNQPGLRALVLAVSHPHAANPGAVRLLLRRTREDRVFRSG